MDALLTSVAVMRLRADSVAETRKIVGEFLDRYDDDRTMASFLVQALVVHMRAALAMLEFDDEFFDWWELRLITRAERGW